MSRHRTRMVAGPALAVLALVLVLSCSASPPAAPEAGGGGQGSEPPGSGRSESGAPEPSMDETPVSGLGADELPAGSGPDPAASSGPDPAAGGTSSPSPAEGLDHPDTSAGGVGTPTAGASPDPEGAPTVAVDAPLEPDLGFAVEVIDEPAPRESAGRSFQEFPLEPVEHDEPGGSGGLPSAQGEVYTWHDGDRTLEARLQLDLVATGDGEVRSRDDVAADTSNGQIVSRGVDGASAAGGASGGHPVFLSDSGTLMTLPGGVIVVLDEDWDIDRAAAFFARNGISPDRVSELDYLANGFFVEAEPGFASLDLANALAGQPGVELSSPNWWRERTTK